MRHPGQGDVAQLVTQAADQFLVGQFGGDRGVFDDEFGENGADHRDERGFAA